MLEFKATQMTIKDALDLERKYIIPRFQREYSWEQEELNTIWQDLLDNLTLKDSALTAQEYFLGSLVLVGDDDDSGNIERFVVDGQQRLMTFTIAFSVLTQIFDKNSEKKLANATFSHILGEDSDGNQYTKLVAQTPKPYFQYRIQIREPDMTKIPCNKEEKRILSAWNFFEKKLDKKTLIAELKEKYPSLDDSVAYLDALKAFRNQILLCKVVYVTVKNYEDAYTIFEVLNAKGKNLTAIDIIKNSLFSILTDDEPLDFATDIWKSIKDNISATEEDMVTFYRHFWLSNYRFTTTKSLVKDFSALVDKNIDSYRKFLDLLKKESIIYRKITCPLEVEWTQPEDLPIYIALDALSVFRTSQVRTFLLAVFEAKQKALISHKIFIKIIKYLEQFHFVFTAICSSRASGLERRYSSYARRLRNCKSKQASQSCITDLINALNESMPNYTLFESKLFDIEFTSDKTRNKSLVQYMLKKLEAYYSKSDELKPQSFTIEHIIPESTKAPSVGLLGNLLPLGEKLNGELANKEFSKKIKRYPESCYESTKAFAKEYKNSVNYTEDNIRERTQKLATILYTDIWN